MTNMFWGLLLKSNKRYSQAVQKSFHISQATLDVKGNDVDDGVVQVWVQTDESNHLLCNLDKKTSQCALDLAISEGETVAFYTKGSGVVHLTGYLMPEEPDFEYGGMGDEEMGEEEEDEEVSEDEAATLKKSKKAIAAADDDEDDDSSDLDEEDLLSDDDEGEEEEAEDEEDEDEADEDEEVAMPPAKVAKIDKAAKVQNGLENGNAAKKPDGQKKKDKKKEKAQANTSDPKPNANSSQPKVAAAAPKSAPRQLAGGVTVEDLRAGKGPEAKAGRKVSVYYEGRLKSNNKVFDSTKAGDGFKFLLGRGEVIRGWDTGVQGMKVGGKRRIICPPNTAYGPRGQPPTIPGNATLVFDVELRGVN